MNSADVAKEDHLVTIIIPNWNGKHFLRTCLNSIFEQIYKNFEVSVVDCASSDGSTDFVKEKYPQVRLIELKEDKGPPRAINLAAQEAKGDYVLILNNDVILPSVLLGKMVCELEKDENCVINPVQLDWDGNYVSSGLESATLGLSKIFKVRGESPFFSNTACCMTSRRVLLENPLNVNFFLYEDTEWGWRLHLRGIKLKVLFGSFFLHKYAGSIGNASPKQAFFVGQSFIATNFICFRSISLIILLPLLLISFIRSGLSWHKRGSKLLKLYFLGSLNFFKKLDLFVKDRRKVQRNRLISDLEILKIIIGSKSFEREAKEQWLSNHRKLTTSEDAFFLQQ